LTEGIYRSKHCDIDCVFLQTPVEAEYSHICLKVEMQAITSTFRSNEPSLSEVLRKIHEGVIQLPDFQRGWVWDEGHFRSLLASISLSNPVSAIMRLETCRGGGRFRPRLIAGAKLTQPIETDFSILDGLRRMTSLYLSLRIRKPVTSKYNQGPIERTLDLIINETISRKQNGIR
jgi:hypothetical protein